MNEENLLKHATHLETNVKASTFNIRTYMSHSAHFHQYRTAVTFKKALLEDCSTVACSVGHATSIFPPIKKEDWEEYCYRVFDVDSDSLEWDFLFSEDWQKVDNTVEGAAKRIRFLIRQKSDLNEDYIREMQEGVEPLCY